MHIHMCFCPKSPHQSVGTFDANMRWRPLSDTQQDKRNGSLRILPSLRGVHAAPKARFNIVESSITQLISAAWSHNLQLCPLPTVDTFSADNRWCPQIHYHQECFPSYKLRSYCRVRNAGAKPHILPSSSWHGYEVLPCCPLPSVGNASADIG